jgi:hypothetical protein
MFDTVTYENIKLSDVIISEVLDSDHFPIVFHILELVRSRNLSDTNKEYTDLEPYF